MITLKPRRALLASVLAAAAVVVAGRAASSADERTGIVRGPSVTLERDGTPAIELTVSSGVTDVRLVASWEGAPAKQETAFAPFERTPRLHAALGKQVPPATRVDYEVVSSQGSLGRFQLKTPPNKNARRFSFCAIGDSGWPKRGKNVATDEQVGVASLLASLDPDAVIHTGDVIYLVGQEAGLDPLFYRPYAATLARVPYFCTLGNHDVKTKEGAPELGGLPHPANQNGGRFYSFDVGNVHFLCLDSNEIVESDEPGDFADTPQGKWLKADLASCTSEWKIAFFHHPLYSGFKKRMPEQIAMRRAVEKTLAEAGVDLCVTGHDHFYHRTARLLDAKPSAEGMVHVLTGGGGAALYPPERIEGITAAAEERFHLVRFQVDGLTLAVEALSPPAEGRSEPVCFDKVQLTARKAH